MKNKKLIATVASLCLVLVAVVAAVVGVLAAAQQKVSNNVSIKYRANDVYATVKAEAKVENGNFQQLLTDANGVTFGRSETSTRTAEATGFQAPLSSNVKYVLYHLTFENLNTSYGMSITGTYKHYGEQPAEGNPSQIKDVNVSAWYKWSDVVMDGTDSRPAEPALEYNQASGAITTVLETSGTDAWVELDTTESPASTVTASITRNVGKSASGSQSIAHLYILVAITDLNADAQYLLGTTTGFFSEVTTAAFYGNSLEFVLARNDA